MTDLNVNDLLDVIWTLDTTKTMLHCASCSADEEVLVDDASGEVGSVAL